MGFEGGTEFGQVQVAVDAAELTSGIQHWHADRAVIVVSRL
ncbi:MAG: hypothetical protein ACM3ML_25240 [Micromonosporaceae bacterium]